MLKDVRSAFVWPTVLIARPTELAPHSSSLQMPLLIKSEILAVGSDKNPVAVR